jgi:hypothetical protein
MYYLTLTPLGRRVAQDLFISGSVNDVKPFAWTGERSTSQFLEGMPKLELAGMTFSYWSVSDLWKREPYSGGTEIWWFYRCQCGTERWVRAATLVSETANGRSTSCGCRKKEIQRARMLANNPAKRGYKLDLPDKEWFQQTHVIERKTVAYIARILGVSKTPVLKRLNDFGIPIRKGSPLKVNLDPVDVVNRAVVQKQSVSQIARELGDGHGRRHEPVNRILREQGVAPRGHLNKVHLSPEDLQKAIELYEVHLQSTAAIGKVFGCGPNPINRILQQAGVRLRSYSECISISNKTRPSLPRGPRGTFQSKPAPNLLQLLPSPS